MLQMYKEIFSGQTIVFDDWDGNPYYDSPKHARRADRVEQFAIAAAGEAFDQVGGPDAVGADRSRFGTIFATVAIVFSAAACPANAATTRGCECPT